MPAAVPIKVLHVAAEVFPLVKTGGLADVAGISFHSLLQVINSPYSWLVMYGGAAAGWMLYFLVPPIVAMVFQVNVDETQRRLEARAKALVEEWGEEVTGRKREG